ncbi:hypothetical protein SAMN05660484_02206 [Eubacterium ruminantium]|uniref:Uncharacterized protein n=1 Tax=Eubacterium ruminantium TaxID=42322 RepID=A0A1T4Q5Q2_9FIRM|nr:hypothetical protein [Eubacterium ruminantium]SCW63907.1 hypothetical protein SAMN05660484_02206 [Eubacterium ruminantium]SDN31689.1 hypothetical protein SAMN04490370_11664 [Eubacterium ruminantium]SJZ99093.1 hypothetical protein SAMN02745110_02277 [Eubacterium ruminantium]
MYYYKVYYDSTELRDSRDVEDYFDDEEEAEIEAKEFIEDRIEQYKADDAWHEYDSRDLFDVIIEEGDD